MKKLSVLLAGFLSLLFLTGCTSIKRFKSAVYKAEDNSLVDMKLFGSRLVGEGVEYNHRTLWDLSAGAQTQLIQILNERYSDNGQFYSALSNEYLSKEDDGAINLTGKKLRMVFTISKKRDYSIINEVSGRFSPADRIEYLKFSVEIPEKYDLQFMEWNRFATEYGEIEIADVSFTRSFDLDTDGSLSQNAEAGVKGTINRNEKQQVRSRYLKLNGSISEHKIEVEEEGTRDLDLTGNVIADVSLEFKGFPERLTIPMFVGPTVAELKFVDVLVPRMKDAPDVILANLQLDYIYRHVQSGWKTYQEWDDKVEYYSGTISKKITLFTKWDYLPTFYTIGTEISGKNSLKVRTRTGTDYPLQFKDFSDASRFLEWLLSISEIEDEIMVEENLLLYKGEPVTVERMVHEDLKVVPVY